MVDTPIDPTVRVMVQHTPALFALLGLFKLSQCAPTIQFQQHTFYRTRSTPRWVFYKAAISGTGAVMDPRQR